jgi:hypothetical protein
MDNRLQMEQHLYRKHLHIMALAARARMLMFLIAFISINLGEKKRLREGT